MQNMRLLVVDDETGMRMAITRALVGYTIVLPEFDGESGLEIETAGSGEEALEILEARGCDILLLDYKLPGISGLEVLDKILADEIDCLTVMITAYASLETAVTATKRGAFDFLAKPFSPDELKAAVSKAAKHLILQRQARKLAEEKKQVRFELTSIVAHELKAPLGAVEGYLNLLQDRTLGDDLESYKQSVDRSVIRLHGMRKLISDLLDLTRIESGQKVRALSPLDLSAIARRSIETVTPDANERNIVVSLTCNGDPSFFGDPGEIEIVFNNLLTNAVKYNVDGGQVDISLECGSDDIRITVADTGIGMEPEDAARLFGEFVRIKNDKTKNIMGTGLGLSITKKIVQLYGGTISVTSTTDAGTTFVIALPRPQDKPETPL